MKSRDNIETWGVGRTVLLPATLLFGAMFNLTLVVAGLKEFIIEDLGGSIADATLFFSVETLAYILFAPIWGVLSDRVGLRRPLVAIGFAGSAVIYFIYGALHSIPLLLALRFVQGSFSVLGWSTVMAMMLDHPVYGRKGRFMGLMGASLIFGVAIGAPMGGYLTRWFGPRAPLLAAAISFALLAGMSLFLHESPTLTRQLRVREILAALRSRPRVALPFSFHFVDRLAVGLFVVVFPLYIDTLGATDPALRGRYLALFLLPFAFLQVLSGRLVERLGAGGPLVVGSLLYGLALCGLGFTDLSSLQGMMVALGVFAAVMFPPAILLVSQWSDPKTRASAMGGFNLAGSMGFALGPILGGWAYTTRGFAFAFVLCGVLEIALAIVGAVLLIRWAGQAGAGLND
jgi:DHA1 family tetracycline resistance protein-like MFS transporter